MQQYLYAGEHAGNTTANAYCRAIDQCRDDDCGECDELQATERQNMSAWKCVFKISVT